MIFPLLLVMASLASCSHAPLEGDRRLSKKERPDFLKSYEGEFYEKTHAGRRTYEVKPSGGDGKVSLTFSEGGQLIEKEEDISFKSLPKELKRRISSHLNQNYPHHRILEVERRMDDAQRHFIDVEIRHESSPSGYWEVSFDLEGQAVGRETEDHHPVETLN